MTRSRMLVATCAGIAAALVPFPAGSAVGLTHNAAQVVVVKGDVHVAGAVRVRAKPLRQIMLGATVVTGGNGWVKLLTRGGCVLMMGPSSRLLLEKNSEGGSCPGVDLEKGQVVLVAAGSWLSAKVRSARVRLRQGRARLVVDDRVRACALDGRLDVRVRAPAAADAGPEKPPGTGVVPSPPIQPRTYEWKPVAGGQCFTAGRFVAGKRDGAAFPVVVPQIMPSVSLDLGPLIPKGQKSSGQEGAEGPGQVSASGGSMCLDSSGSGSAAGNVQQGPQPIDKPPPTTRLRVRVTVPVPQR